MKKLLLTTSMLLSIAAYSQVGINTQKGTLDVTAKKQMERPLRGLLLPVLPELDQAADTQ